VTKTLTLDMTDNFICPTMSHLSIHLTLGNYTFLGVVVIRKKKTIFNCYKLQKGVAMRMIRVLGFLLWIPFPVQCPGNDQMLSHSPMPLPAQLYTFPHLESIYSLLILLCNDISGLIQLLNITWNSELHTKISQNLLSLGTSRINVPHHVKSSISPSLY